MTKLKLESTPQPLCPIYAPSAATAHRRDDGGSADAAAVAWMNLAGEALDPAFEVSRRYVRASGAVTVVNTMEAFKELNKKDFLNEVGARMCAQVDSGAAEVDPSLLVRCEGVVFSDLKNYKHVYWFAFPALCLPLPPVLVGAPSALAARLPTPAQRQHLHQGVRQLQDASGSGTTPPFFVVELGAGGVCVRPLSDLRAVAATGSEWWLAFVDPSSLPTNPGWPLRNALFLLQRLINPAAVTVLCYRDVLDAKDPPSQSRSLVMQVRLQEGDAGADASSGTPPAAVGWEANAKGKMGARMVDLAPFMDPQRRAIESSDLNLKLMRWRFLPELDIEKLSRTKVLCV